MLYFFLFLKELKRSEMIGHTTIYPAVAGQDFVVSEGKLTFEPGQKNVVLYITLTPETASLNPYPKRFQVLLVNPTGGAKIDKQYGTANITILSDSSSQATWGLLDQLYQPYDEVILNRVLQTLNNKAGAEFTQEQLGATMSILEKVKMQMYNVITLINATLLLPHFLPLRFLLTYTFV